MVHVKPVRQQTRVLRTVTAVSVGCLPLGRGSPPQVTLHEIHHTSPLRKTAV